MAIFTQPPKKKKKCIEFFQLSVSQPNVGLHKEAPCLHSPQHNVSSRCQSSNNKVYRKNYGTMGEPNRTGVLRALVTQITALFKIQRKWNFASSLSDLIWGLPRGVNDTFPFLGSYLTYVSSQLPWFRENMLVPSSSTKQSELLITPEEQKYHFGLLLTDSKYHGLGNISRRTG